jgi:ribosomal protein S27E
MTKSPTADQLPPPGPSNVVYRDPQMWQMLESIRRVSLNDISAKPKLLTVNCPHCGKKYTRATAGSTVEVACRGCKEVTIVALIAA